MSASSSYAMQACMVKCPPGSSVCRLACGQQYSGENAMCVDGLANCPPGNTSCVPLNGKCVNVRPPPISEWMKKFDSSIEIDMDNTSGGTVFASVASMDLDPLSDGFVGYVDGEEWSLALQNQRDSTSLADATVAEIAGIGSAQVGSLRMDAQDAAMGLTVSEDDSEMVDTW
jgi:hypothetical protein